MLDGQCVDFMLKGARNSEVHKAHGKIRDDGAPGGIHVDRGRSAQAATDHGRKEALAVTAGHLNFILLNIFKAWRFFQLQASHHDTFLVTCPSSPESRDQNVPSMLFPS
ncbi:hypothetical protein J3458_021909 [Metarhizium acridum]|uniref:uncharacterized protein n=1 Tax=Metarhizium acridum TaxID=92637 RepID=UPI001C6C9038|nr:hypothetical protein J3458_021909 [Metarhizium acridum]